MSRHDETPSWYSPGKIQSTVQQARSAGVDAGTVTSVLDERELEDVPDSRIESIVDRIPEETDDKTSEPLLSQPPSTDATPRTVDGRRLDVGDVEFLSNREAARVLGLVLEAFDGNTIRTGPQHEVESDLIWNRQHSSVALRVVPLPDSSVGSRHVDALLDGQTVPPERRSPSELAIVTNRGFTEDALEFAAENDVRCLDGGHLEAWLQRVLLPMDAVGTILEEGENHGGPLSELVDVPAVPEPRLSIEPLGIDPIFDVETTEETPSPERPARRDDPLAAVVTDAGQTGTLYANPDEDGDYDAFDDYLEDL
jgi:hypothetical protein